MESYIGAQKSADPEDTKAMKIMAEQFVSDVIQTSLSKMLLRAEAGEDTENILNALKKIQVTDIKDDCTNTVILWNPSVPSSSKTSQPANEAPRSRRYDSKAKSKARPKPSEEDEEITRL